MARKRSATRQEETVLVDAFLAPNMLGGAFIVSIFDDSDEERVLCRLHTTDCFAPWDGRSTVHPLSKLKPFGKISIPARVAASRPLPWR